MPKRDPRSEIPDTFLSFIDRHPDLGEAHERIARAVDSAGPLDRKTCELIKIGLSIGAGLETATRSHVRRALDHGATPAEIEQAILLAMNTCGFPRTVAAWKWAQKLISPEAGASRRASSVGRQGPARSRAGDAAGKRRVRRRRDSARQ